MRLIIFIVASLLIINANAQITKALETFNNQVGTKTQKTFSQYGDLIDFTYYNKDSARYDYLTVKTDGSIVCFSQDAEESFPPKIIGSIQSLYPREYRKKEIGNYRIGKDNDGNILYIIMLTEKDKLIIFNSSGRVIYEFDME
jgi:hypothetical protein